ncbi:hypothetical protein AeNC1_003802 [Aphanomyces euteiches]|nr:hypothetical protein AeNC1_003802 [Aphanomyces euteiches]
MQKLLVDTKDVNPHFICTLCHGYFRQPYTIRECIHTFCKSCIFRYIVSGVGNNCPICQLEFGTYPLSGTKTKPPQIVYVHTQDHVMEGLVRKLFPQLDVQDKVDEEKFYKKLNFKTRNESIVSRSKEAKFKRMKGQNVKMILRPVKSTLRACGPPPRTKELTFGWKLPDKNRVSDLKLCLRKMLGKVNVPIELGEIQIRCKDKILGKEHSLQFIQKTMWKRSSPIEMEYRRIDESTSTLDAYGPESSSFAERDI